MIHQIKVHPFPAVPEEHIGAAAQLDPWLADFALLSVNSGRGCFLLDHAVESL